MSSRSFAAVMILFCGIPDSLGLAQDTTGTPAKTKPRTFDVAGPAKGNPARGVEIVAPPAKPKPVKIIEVNQEGSGYAKDRNYVVGIESIVVSNDGTMTWTYFLKNKSNQYHTTWIVGPKSYVADMQAETFKPISMQYPPNGDGYHKLQVAPGTKETFWFTFPAPREKTDKFRVMLGAYDLYLAGIPFDAFTVKLAEPIGPPAPKAMVAEEGLVIIHEEEKVEGEKPAPRMPSPTAPSPANNTGGLKTAMSGAEKEAEAFLALSENGLTVNGGINSRFGGNIAGRIVFRKRPLDELVEARIVSTTKNSAINIEVIGAFLEDFSTPSGLSLKMVDFAKVRYTFSLSGNNLSGEDSLGNKYSFVISAR